MLYWVPKSLPSVLVRLFPAHSMTRLLWQAEYSHHSIRNQEGIFLMSLRLFGQYGQNLRLLGGGQTRQHACHRSRGQVRRVKD